MLVLLSCDNGKIDKKSTQNLSDSLNMVYSWTLNDTIMPFSEKQEHLKNYLTLELIDPQLFDSKKNTSVEFLFTDTTVIRKKNNELVLKCEKTVVKYKNSSDEEMMSGNGKRFDYVGQIPFLNKYIIRADYYEALGYILIDKISGKETQGFENYPNISTDKKHIICIGVYPYNQISTNLQLFSLNGTEIKQVATLRFAKWLPKMNQEDKFGRSEAFWSNDGYFYVRADGDYNKKIQYIRIKVL